MKAIHFFNYCHNGDVFHTKSFVNFIANSVDNRVYFSHKNHPIITADLDVEFIKLTGMSEWGGLHGIPEINYQTKIFETKDSVYINTWPGSYNDDQQNPYVCECSLRAFHRLFKFAILYLNENLNTNIILDDSPEKYFPTIDFNRIKDELNIGNVDSFLKANQSEKILFSNGPCLSNQCSYNDDMSSLINSLAQKYSNKLFIATYKFPTLLNNIFFAEDIIKSDKCDLNEISYLSTFCKLIVGRNSGPFCFTCIPENINDKSKVFYAFGTNASDCLPYELDIESNYIFEPYQSLEIVESSLDEILK